MTATRKKAVETAKIAEAIETAGASKDGKENKDDEYPEKLTQVPCIWYSIIFWKKFLPVLALLDSGSEINAIYPTFA